MLAVAIASSYLTLVAFAYDRAQDLLWPYAVVMFVLTCANLAALRAERDRDRC